MFFEIAVLHLFGKFLETHLWKSTFQQSCHHMLATMLKKFILWRKFFKVFHESLKYSCCNEHQGRKIWTSKNKPNNSKGAGRLCLNYDHSRICFYVSCKSMKRKSWCPRMVIHTHTHARTHARARMHTHTHTHTHTHIHTHTHEDILQ